MPERRINAAGLSLVKAQEGLRLQAYRDMAGIPTIGWGHTLGVKMGQVITLPTAEQFLRDDLAGAESAVSRFVTVPLNDNQFSALVSLTFNIGVEAFRRSTLRKKLNAGDYEGAAAQFLVWNKTTVNGKKVVAKGLVTRRAKERDLFNTPFVAAAPPEPPVSAQKPSPTVPIPGKPETRSAAKHRGIAAALVLLVAAAWAAVSGLLCSIPFISNLCGG